MSVNTMQIFKGVTFPNTYSWGVLEQQVIDIIGKGIDYNFKDQNNLFVNGTWFSPNINAELYNEVLLIAHNFDNVFFLTTVDPPKMTVSDITAMFQPAKIYFLGNFETEYEFSFIAWAISKEFKTYDDLELKEIKYKFINYNRKPAPHRVSLVKKIIASGLDKKAIVTLGKSTDNYCHDNELYVSIGEKDVDFVETGHWFELSDSSNSHGIPHDLLSLGNLNYWNYHFLNVVSETEFFPWDPIFVTEKTFKPIMGLRPFIINGNTRTYHWLRKYGFKTFTHYFPSDLENAHEDSVHPNIIKTLQWVNDQTETELMEMYNDMLPDLYHNQARLHEFASEQEAKMQNLF